MPAWDALVLQLAERGKVTYPEETGKVGPVPGAGVEHVGCEDGSDDADNNAVYCKYLCMISEGLLGLRNLLKHTTKSNGLDLQSSRRNFTDK